MSGPGVALPHRESIAATFGRHDVGDIEAHVGGPAADAASAIGASAYATGNHVAFAGSPDLHTAAHEAAHVVQQRGGVQPAGGVGRAGDVHEHHADAVADRVVRGESAEGLLDQMGPVAGSGAQRTPVQLRGEGEGPRATGGPPAAARPASATAHEQRGDDAAAHGAGPREDTWQALLGEKLTAVGRMGRVEAPKGLRLRASPTAGAPTLAILPFDTLVHVERKTEHGWYYVVSMGDARGGASVTGAGCVEGQHVELDAPEPTAHLHFVKPGEMLKDIAAQHYKPRRGFEWGADARLHVEAIWEANKSTGKLIRVGGGLSWDESLVRSDKQEKTLAIWRSVQTKHNHAIWIPSQAFVDALDKAGAISGGSISHAAWQTAQHAAQALVHFAQYRAGYAVGAHEGSPPRHATSSWAWSISSGWSTTSSSC